MLAFDKNKIILYNDFLFAKMYFFIGKKGHSMYFSDIQI